MMLIQRAKFSVVTRHPFARTNGADAEGVESLRTSYKGD
jgi:hypothetical protein